MNPSTSRSTSSGRCVDRITFCCISKRLTSVQNILSAISRVRFENGKTPPVIRQFLVDQLRYNDNTTNPVSRWFGSPLRVLRMLMILKRSTLTHSTSATLSPHWVAQRSPRTPLSVESSSQMMPYLHKTPRTPSC